jgi:HlyD family secretion protein
LNGSAHSTTTAAGRFWSGAALGFGVLAAANAVLLGYAWIHFALANPAYFTDGWPTFSRALTLQNVLYPALAALAGTGLFAGGWALALMQWERARKNPALRAPLMVRALCGLVAAALGIVHYFHVTVTLSVDNGAHMALAFTFFFGMSLLIAADLGCSLALEKRGLRDAAAAPRRVRTQHRVGAGVIAAAAAFLVTFVLKDAAWNPWTSATQKAFVCFEALWVTLAHAYAVLYVLPLRRHFGVEPTGAAARVRRLASSAAVVLVGAAACTALPHAGAHAATPATPSAAIGGTGRIQPAGGVIVVSAAPGRSVDQVLVKEGDRVRKGALLLTLSDQSVRALERDLAAERLHNAERQSVERRKAAELELQTAKLTLTQARAEAAAVAQLDERTFPAREKRSRDNAVAQANVALQSATAKLDDARKSGDAELRMARTNLKLAEAALLATRVVAPTDATVLEVQVQPGSSAGGPAITLADTSRMYVVADFFEGDLPRLGAGQRVKVSNAALGQTLDGAVERIGRVIDPVNRLAKVWVRLDKPAPADRFIGMQVDVKVDSAAPAKDKRS